MRCARLGGAILGCGAVAAVTAASNAWPPGDVLGLGWVLGPLLVLVTPAFVAGAARLAALHALDD